MGICGGGKTVQRKLVLLGDGACGTSISEAALNRGKQWVATSAKLTSLRHIGKTSLLNVFTRGFFPTVYEPTVFENYVHDIFVDGIHMELSLWDTAGQEEFDRLRSLSYDDTQAIMLCFSVDNPGSLENVKTKWIQEIGEHCPGVKIVLCALKCDLREEQEKDDESAQPPPQTIQYKDGLETAKAIGALRYLECSAMRNRGVNEAFTEAARVALQVKPAKAKDDSKCTIM